MEFRTFYINKKRIKYKEMTVDSNFFEKFYLIENSEQDDIVAIPDGCVDVEFVWENGVCHGYVCGSFLKGKYSTISRYQRCFGVKLKPGVPFSFMTKSAKNILDSRVLLSEFVDASHLEKRLGDTDDFLDMITYTLRFFMDQGFAPVNIIASSTVDLIMGRPEITRVADIVHTLGYSQRYINNVFQHYFGLPVKKFSDIIRMQIAIKSMESQSVMDIVSTLGYYDQAHFIHDFKQYTSLTPKKYLDQARGEEKIIV